MGNLFGSKKQDKPKTQPTPAPEQKGRGGFFGQTTNTPPPGAKLGNSGRGRLLG